MSRTAGWLIVLPVIAVTVGCTSGVDYGPTGTAAGRLTMEKKPLLPATQVIFMHPEKGYAAFGTTDSEGKFKITSWNEGKLPIGKYEVMIQPPAGPDPDSKSAEELLAPQTSESSQVEFPVKYRQTFTSGLVYEVKVGPNSYEIELTK